MRQSGSARSSDDDDVVVIDQDDIRNYNADNILPEPPEVIDEIRKWLEPTEYNLESSEYQKHLASHLDGTGEWLLSSERYRQWHENEHNGLLWIKGIPGSGKSVFAAQITQQLSKKDVPVLHFFFRQIIDANHRPVNLLRDWLDQVLVHSPPLQQELKGYVEGGRPLESVSIDDLWKHLRTALAHLPLVFCIVDALDEMDQGSEGFVRELASLGHWQPSRVKILMTSRPVPSVEVPMRYTKCIEIRLEEQLVDMDITTYVRHALAHSKIPEKDHERIKLAVPGRANGLFLYAKLAMNAFLEPGADVDEVLARLPLDLNELYTGILSEHARRSEVPLSTQTQILQWVTHSVRPLRLLELAAVLKSMDTYKNVGLKDLKAFVRAACGPLLEILPDETVSIIHHSLTEFLTGKSRSQEATGFPVFGSASTHVQLAMSCLDYLQAGCLTSLDILNRRESTKKLRSQLVLDFPFASYAMEFWYYHASLMEPKGAFNAELIESIDSFLAKDVVRTNWLVLNPPDGQVFNEKKEVDSISDLHIAAHCCLIEYVNVLLDRDVKSGIDARDLLERTPLWRAADQGHTTIVKTLLSLGADPDAEDTYGFKPLHQAAKVNHYEVIQLLLDAGVDPLTPRNQVSSTNSVWDNVPTAFGHTPLMYACHNGHFEAVETFLPLLDSPTKQHALAWAVSRKRTLIIKRLLKEPDVDANRKIMGNTPLFQAANCGDIPSMEVLLAAGADASILCVGPPDEFEHSRDQASHTVLKKFCCSISASSVKSKEEIKRIFKLLIQAGADVNKPNSNGETALHVTKHPLLTELLLDAGADANAMTENEETALHYNCKTYMRSEAVDRLELLVKKGKANLDMKEREKGKTPMLMALVSPSPKLALRMLQFGADCNLADNDGNAGLHHIFMHMKYHSRMTDDFREYLHALLKAGAIPNQRNFKGETPLHIFVSLFDEYPIDMAKVLQEHGGDINARDIHGQTPIFHAVPWSHGKRLALSMNRFRELGADIQVVDSNGRSIIHQVVQRLSIRALDSSHGFSGIKYFVDAGLSPLAVDYEGNTLVHEVTKVRPTKWATSRTAVARVFEELQEFGLDIDQPNYVGVTPLHLVCQYNSDESAGMALALDWLLRNSKCLESEMLNGVRPVHLAATMSENVILKIINAGADVFASTNEGMNLLHIASRCDQSNIVGLVLQRMREIDPSKATRAANQRNCAHYTPLHYACRSGRPETVALLLEAGADANPPYPEGYNKMEERWYPPLFQCVFFKHERHLWEASASSTRSVDAPAIGVKDDRRPPRQRQHRLNFEQMTMDGTSRNAGFEGIMELLLAAGADLGTTDPSYSRSFLSNALDDAVKSQDDYITNLLLQLHHGLGDGKTLLDVNPLAHVFRARRQTAAKALLQAYPVTQGSSNWPLVKGFLCERQYSAIVDIYKAGASFITPENKRMPILTSLAEWGLASLVDACCTSDEVSLLDNPDWCAQYETEASDYFRGKLKPLLLDACKREVPNMDVLRVLVEKKAVNINTQSRFYESLDSDLVPSTSALHVLARGSSWWQVHQAIPYLVSKGANLELRDHFGKTPLLIALDQQSIGCSPFRQDAAKLLLKLGADIHAVDDEGTDCLSMAREDEALIKLLINYGAAVTPSAVTAGIEKGNPGVLKALLSSLDTLSLRQSWTHTLADVSKQDPRSQELRSMCEDHPLFKLSCMPRATHLGRSAKIQLIQILLENGIGPYDTFVKDMERVPLLREEKTSLPYRQAQVAWKRELSEQGRFRELTLFHEILSHARISEPFFELPSLDLEHRDAFGRTPLLASYRRKGPAVETSLENAPQALLERGANKVAVDDMGRNALHHLLGSQLRWEDQLGCLEDLESVFPELINQADKLGYYPLHYALGECVGANTSTTADISFDYLIAHGADPFVRDANGNTALHYLASGLCCLKFHTGIHARDHFKLFAQRGVDVNARNKASQTPLHFLRCFFGNMSSPSERMGASLDLLEDLGVDWKARDSRGRTLLHEIPDAEPDLFRAVVDRGVDLLAEDCEGRTSLDFAAACQNEGVLAMFESKRFTE